MNIQASSIITQLTESPTLKIFAEVKKIYEQGIALYNFGIGEVAPTIPLPEPIKTGIIQAIQNNETQYTSPEGYHPLIHEICEDLKVNFKLNYTEEQICVCPGVKDALAKTLLVVLNPLIERNLVIIFKPTYEAFKNLPFLITGKPPIILDCDSQFQPDLIMLENELKKNADRIAAIIINSPNNPSGAIYSREIIEKMVDILKGYPHIAILSDEVYRTFIYTNVEHISIASYLPNQTFIIGGMSKEVVGSGLRLGWVAGPKYIISSVINVQGNFTGSCNLPVQKGYTKFLKEDRDMHYRNEIVQGLAKKRQIILEYFNTLEGLKQFIYSAPPGAMYFFPNVTNYYGKRSADGKYHIRSDKDLVLYLLNVGHVVTIPGSDFLSNGYIRIAFAAISMDDLKKGLQAMNDALLLLIDDK